MPTPSTVIKPGQILQYHAGHAKQSASYIITSVNIGTGSVEVKLLFSDTHAGVGEVTPTNLQIILYILNTDEWSLLE